MLLKKIYKTGRHSLWTIHREYLRNQHKLRYLFWECTLNCNFKCKHCGSNAGEKFIEETLKTDEIKKALLDISQNFNAHDITIAITGGEPLLRKDLFEVMSYASSLGFNWGMVTNGSLVTIDTIKKAKKAGMQTVDISIDGIKDIHDNFRNTIGAYKKALNAINLFAQENFLRTLRITTTVNKKNIESLQAMYDVFSKLPVTHWRLVNVDPIGRSEGNKEILLGKNQFRMLLEFVKEIRKKKSGLKVTLGCAHFLGDYEDEVRDFFFYCSTGINIGTILHNGDIFCCPNVPRKKELIQGNIKKDSFSEVWKNKFEIFRNKNRTSCEDCKKCSNWNECLGGSFHTWDFENKQQKFCLFK